jgi:uncharacterized protein (TIGR02145 family)
MQYSATEGAQGICPNGWHIPSEAEWTDLANYLDPTIGGTIVFNSNNGTDIGTKLKPGGSSGFGFNLAGVKSQLAFGFRDNTGIIFSSTERDSTTAYAFSVIDGAGTINKGGVVKDNYFVNVRCIKD